MYYIYFIYYYCNMRTKYLKPMIEILMKKSSKIISDNQIMLLQQSILSEQLNTSQFYKLIFMLKKRGYLIPLKKDLYRISSPHEDNLGNEYLVEEYYRSLLYKHIKSTCKWRYYIGSSKWIEMLLHNNDVTQEITIYNEKRSKKEVVMLDHSVLFKTYTSNRWKNREKKDIWSSKDMLATIGIKKSSLVSIKKHRFSVWPLELCVLESLYYETHHDTTYLYDLIKRAIKKYKRTRDRWLLKKIISLERHHTSINRLAQLMITVDQSFAQQCIDIINKVWFKISLKS